MTGNKKVSKTTRNMQVKKKKNNFDSFCRHKTECSVTVS